MYLWESVRSADYAQYMERYFLDFSSRPKECCGPQSHRLDDRGMLKIPNYRANRSVTNLWRNECVGNFLEVKKRYNDQFIYSHKTDHKDFQLQRKFAFYGFLGILRFKSNHKAGSNPVHWKP